MVSNASDDFPEPESPVITTSLSRGISTSMFLRLCSRAPLMTIFFIAAAGSARATPKGAVTPPSQISSTCTLSRVYRGEAPSPVRGGLAERGLEQLAVHLTGVDGKRGSG